MYHGVLMPALTQTSYIILIFITLFMVTSEIGRIPVDYIAFRMFIHNPSRKMDAHSSLGLEKTSEIVTAVDL